MRICTWKTGAVPRRGDCIFAQHSDYPRRIMGIAEITKVGTVPTDLWMKPVEQFERAVWLPFGEKLKAVAPRVASIHAMRPISGSLILLDSDQADVLARFCEPYSVSLMVTSTRRKTEALLSNAGGGFGDPAENGKLELAGIRAAILHFKKARQHVAPQNEDAVPTRFRLNLRLRYLNIKSERRNFAHLNGAQHVCARLPSYRSSVDSIAESGV